MTKKEPRTKFVDIKIQSLTLPSSNERRNSHFFSIEHFSLIQAKYEEKESWVISMDKENIYKRIAESKQVNAKMILFVFVHRKKTEWNSFSHMHSISMPANMQALNWKKWTKTKSGRKIRTHTNTDRRHKRKLNHSIFSKKNIHRVYGALWTMKLNA